MSATLFEPLHRRDWQVPTGILTNRPRQAEQPGETTRAQPTGTQPPTYLHPLTVLAAAAGYAWMLFVFWVIFAGHGYMSLAIFVATLISGVMLGLMVGLGEGGRNVVPWQRPWRSFSEYLSGEVDVWGTHIRGREAFIQLAGMAWCLAALATAFAIIVALARP